MDLVEPIEKLKNYLQSFMSIPPLEWPHLIKSLRYRSLKKDEHFFKQGEVFGEIGFVAKGLLYNYYTNRAGDEFVKIFVKEGEPVSPYSSQIQGIPANYSCKALENTHLITLKFEALQNLYRRHACWERLGRLNAEKYFINKESREHEFLIADAKGRYEHFVRDHQELINRVPQYLIASYLGMSPVSLSRIRQDT